MKELEKQLAEANEKMQRLPMGSKEWCDAVNEADAVLERMQQVLRSQNFHQRPRLGRGSTRLV